MYPVETSYRVVAVEDLVEPAVNPNSLDPGDYTLLVHGMKSEGFLQPILVVDLGDGRYEIVDGVHRTRAAAEAGHMKVPCKVLPCGYPPDKVELLRLALNKLRGQLSTTTAAQILDRISKSSPDLDLTLSGYSADAIQDLLSSVQDVDLDDLLISAGMGSMEDVEVPERASTYTLELTFSSSKQLAAVKRELRKRAGKGNDLSVGLLDLLEIE